MMTIKKIIALFLLTLVISMSCLAAQNTMDSQHDALKKINKGHEFILYHYCCSEIHNTNRLNDKDLMTTQTTQVSCHWLPKWVICNLVGNPIP